MNQKHSPSAGTGSDEMDAIELLILDHNRVKDLFEKFEMLQTEEDAENDKLDLAQQICTELTIHTKLEEEIFYPAAIEEIGQLDIMDEAAVEHAAAKEMIEQLVAMAPEDEYFDAKVKVLKDMVEHHITEEEGQMFPRLKKTAMDLASLGERMSRRKQELHMDMGMLGASMSKGQEAVKPVRGPMR
jgi:hypothetical protein